jgi:ubiquinone/menaquinone biosynthesis C-methylase UbiE
MTSKEQEGNGGDKNYEAGAHWERGPSRNMEEFVPYLNKGDKILDAGCGSGRDAIYLAQQGFEVWGIDISEVAIERARQKYEGKNLHLNVGNIERLDFQDSEFGAVYSGWVLHSTNLQKAASEMHRILRSNGVAYLALLLNTKYLDEREDEHHLSERDIVSAFANFQIEHQREFEVDDTRDEKNPHKHDALILVLKK